MSLGTIKDYYLRIRRASPAEVVYRARRSIGNAWLKYRFRQGPRELNAPEIDRAFFRSLKLPDLECRLKPVDIERIIGGERFTLNFDPEMIRGFESRYSNRFFATIRPPSDGIDIRAVWEPARLQHLTAAIVWALNNCGSKLAGSIQAFVRHSVLDWIDRNLFLFGPHFLSSMECGLRTPVFFYCLKFLDELPLQDFRKIANSIYRHGWWIFRRPSLYASLGNHTVCEALGLVFAGAVFSEGREGRKWLSRGLDLLQQELTHQILKDGGPAEQSLAYHRFVLDVYRLAADFLEKNGFCDCSRMKEHLLRGEDFLAAFELTPGCWPAIGDSDDGHAVAPGIAPKTRSDPTAARSSQAVRVFADSGYTVIRTRDNAVVTFDHGPLGMAPLFNHGHADALSLTLAISGYPLLVDPGTYRYNGASDYRRYFKGTRAHNTVNIDNEDQAVQETGFIWSRPYRCGVTHRQERGRDLFITAEHDGYERLNPPVRHRRALLKVDGAGFVVKDSFLGRGSHGFELNYHLHPEASVERLDEWWLVRRGQARIAVRLLESPGLSLTRGSELPILGWYSSAYGLKRPAPVLSAYRRGAVQDVFFVTLIAMESPPAVYRDLMDTLSHYEREIESSQHLG